MPNIYGTCGGDEFPRRDRDNSKFTGAFYDAGGFSDTAAGSGHPSRIIGIDASRCSEIYKNNFNTVRPPSLVVNAWLRTA